MFHGRDQLHAHQELDGIVYQLVPMPADDNLHSGCVQKGQCATGMVLRDTGVTDVNVSAEQATVSYGQACQPEDENENRRNGSVAHQYQVLPIVK